MDPSTASRCITRRTAVESPRPVPGLAAIGQLAGGLRVREARSNQVALTNAAWSSTAIIQRRFAVAGRSAQESHHGGVKSEFGIDPTNPLVNRIELHIDAGANASGTLMQDFLLALYESRDAIRDGLALTPAVAGYVFMRPGGSKVMKMTMEMLGEALGTQPALGLARQAKAARPNPLPPHRVPGQAEDIIHQDFTAEHLAYRDSLVGTQGLTMAPIGGGTGGGMTDMLVDGVGPAAVAAQHERALYDAAVNGLRPFLSVAVCIQVNEIEAIIAMMESRAGFFERLSLRAKYLFNG